MDCAADDMSSTGLRVASFACYLDSTKDTSLHKISAQADTAHPIHVLNSAAKAIPASNGSAALTNLRVDSFSYLNTAGDHGFVFNVPKPIQNPPNNSFTFPKEIPCRDNEISVFGADKYFNAIDGMIRPDQHRKQPPLNLQNPRIIRPPSFCSEASTLNSRTVLLRNGSNAKHRKASRRSAFLAPFRCQGPCFDRKDVSIKDDTCNSIPNQVHVPIPRPAGTGNIEESRNSIEVFGSGMMASSKGDVAANLERKLSMLTWDAIPKGGTAPSAAASTVRTSTVCDDMASDASSDLFEIENITGSMYPMLTATAEADVAGCLSPASQYAPSEASIQWSVVTASAADYSSVISECCNNDESVIVNNNVLSRTNSRKNCRNAVRPPKGRAGGLLGCKSQKAVDVAENINVRCKNGSEKVKELNFNLPV